MRILFSSLPFFGHFYPVLPLAAACKEAGHEVLFATHVANHETLAELGVEPVVAGVGLDSRASAAAKQLGMDVDPRTETPPQELIKLAVNAFGSLLPRRFAGDLESVLDERKPDLVVWEVGNLGAMLAAKRAGIPSVVHGYGCVSDFEVMVAEVGRQTAADLGIEVPSGRTFGDRFIDVVPESLQDKGFLADPDVVRVPLRPVAFSRPSPLPAIVAAERDRPLVYLTLGTVYGSPEALRTAIDGLASLDVDVLVAADTSAQAEALRGLPANVAVESWVPQARVLPHVDLVVHHGGAGTTLGSLSEGVPQLLLPQGADQFVHAAAVSEAAAGVQVLPFESSAEAVATQAKLLLGEPEYAVVARRIAGEIAAMPAPVEVAAALPELV